MRLYFIRIEHRMLPCASQAFLCRELTGPKYLCFTQLCFITPLPTPETLNLENLLKHTRAFILKIRTTKTQKVLIEPGVRNWTLWICLKIAAKKKSTHLMSTEIQTHS